MTDEPAAAKSWQQTSNNGNGRNGNGRDQYSGVNLYEMRDIPASRGGPKANPAFQDDPRHPPVVSGLLIRKKIREGVRLSNFLSRTLRLNIHVFHYCKCETATLVTAQKNRTSVRCNQKMI